jgi:transcriptional regulator NrdR
LKCPFCSHLEDKVVDSRESKEGDVIRRRRECLDCGKRFTSYERIDQIPHLVVKKDGRRERFDREKVMQGLLKACEKRPVPVKALELVVERVEAPEGARQGGLRPLRLGLPRLQGRGPVHGHAQGTARSAGLSPPGTVAGELHLPR